MTLQDLINSEELKIVIFGPPASGKSRIAHRIRAMAAEWEFGEIEIIDEPVLLEHM